KLHLAAFEGGDGPAGAGAGVLSLVAAGGGLAVAAADAAADPLLLPQLVYADVYGGQVHDSTPLERHPTQSRHFLAGSQGQQPLDGSLDEIDGVAAAVDLGEDVANATK